MPNKKISDKERLDWLRRTQSELFFVSGLRWKLKVYTYFDSHLGETPRAAIDAAIRADRASKPKKGGKL